MSTQCIYSLSDFLGQVITQKCWTAWLTEERKNKTTGEVKFTKVPYQAVTSESRSNDPTTWISIDGAEAVASTEGFINGGIGGVGLWLGIEYGTEYRVGGVDLDTCLTPSGLAPWAKQIIERFNTYGEISPSKTGIKLYFLYRIVISPTGC
jgi:primase-polymerase (primpol)-like protein